MSFWVPKKGQLSFSERLSGNGQNSPNNLDKTKVPLE